MADIAIAGADPIPTAAPSPAKDNPGGAGRFGDALGAAVAGGASSTDDGTTDASGSTAPTSQAAGTAPSLLGAAAALAAMLGRGSGASGAGATPSTPAGRTAPGAAAAAADASGAAAGDPGVDGDAAASAVGPSPLPVAKPGSKSGHDDGHDDDASATAATPTPTAPVAGTPGTPAPVAPVVPPDQPHVVAAPVQAASAAKVGAATRAGARTDPRLATTDADADDAAPAAALPAATDAKPTPDAAAATASTTPTPGSGSGSASSDSSGSSNPGFAPVQQLVPVAAAPSAQPAAPVLVATTDPTVAQQLQGPLLSLRSAPDGEHVMVVRVSPDQLGPVTVHATVSHGDLTVQLIASTSGGHDALQSMMTDLRRDLGAGATGTATTLSLSTGDAPQQDRPGQQTTWVGTGAGGSSSGGPGARDDRPAWSGRTRRTDDTTTTLRIPTTSSALLDVLA